MHSQTSLYSLDEEISLRLKKRTNRETFKKKKKVEKGTVFFFFLKKHSMNK